MIIGIGSDVVDIRRVERLLERYGARFAERILTPFERAQVTSSVDFASYVAGRFAAKEALAKAVGTGLRHPVTWQNMEVRPDAMGRPHLHVSDELRRAVGRASLRIHLSLTHDAGIALAMVVVEQTSDDGPVS